MKPAKQTLNGAATIKTENLHILSNLSPRWATTVFKTLSYSAHNLSLPLHILLILWGKILFLVWSAKWSTKANITSRKSIQMTRPSTEQWILGYCFCYSPFSPHTFIFRRCECCLLCFCLFLFWSNFMLCTCDCRGRTA